jgi:hypothetical protein
VRALRNIAIIMLLALLLAAVPGGGAVSEGIFATFTIAFMVVIGASVYFGYRQNRLTWLTLPERDRHIFVAALGALVYMIGGSQVILDWDGGVLVFLAVLGIALYAMFTVVTRARAI